MAETKYTFPQGGGEMGRLIRDYNWAATSTGGIMDWPLSLRTLVQMMLASRFPMLIFWGTDLITFYNDAFRPSLGNNGKHPSSLGQKGEQSWAESWPVIGPMIYTIMAGGEAVWFEDQKLPIYREGQMGYAYWTYSFSPLTDDAGRVNGVLVTCSETTKAVESIQQLAESKEQQELAIEAAELGTWDLNPATGNFSANARLKKWFGLQPDETVPLSLALDVIAGTDRNRVTAAINRAMEFDSGGRYEEEYVIIHPQTSEERIVQAKGQAQFNEAGEAIRLNGTLRDITQQVRQQQRKEKEQGRLLSLFEQSSIGIAIISRENLTFTMANTFYGVLVDRPPAEITGKPLLEALPEIAGQGFDLLLNKVIETGEPFIASEIAVQIRRGDSIQTIYVHLAYQPMREDDGSVLGVLVIATDITQGVLARKVIETNEAKFRSLIEEAPFATALYAGRELKIDIANEAMLNVWGKTPAVVGMPLAEALPELEGQPFLDILSDVFDTGTTYSTREQSADLMIDGKLKRSWFNFTYKPLFDEVGQVYAILNMAVDVSEQVTARKQTEEAELKLLAAIDVAQLGTWSIDANTKAITYSPRLQQWLGIKKEQLQAGGSAVVVEEDRKRVYQAILRAMLYGGSGEMDEIYTIVNQMSGQKRVIHINGKTIFDAEGRPVLLSGTAQDITLQKDLQTALEEEVQIRTEELAAAAEELRTTNEELAESNEQLVRSNEELAQYAYVASHDLQEPLRKIQFFSTLLREREQSADERAATVERISSSTRRMSLLINDLLDFSRLLNSDSLMRPVNLKALAHDVINDFELVIEEKKARINLGELPSLEGVSLQFNQLFTNLISNALKFSKDGQPPIIDIIARQATKAEVAEHIQKSVGRVDYYSISVTDNGIGFEPEYTAQIFEVFKRLHGKSEYSGSGIGLAICRRVVQNHQGAIYAVSEPNHGASFRILLPVAQHM